MTYRNIFSVSSLFSFVSFNMQLKNKLVSLCLIYLIKTLPDISIHLFMVVKSLTKLVYPSVLTSVEWQEGAFFHQEKCDSQQMKDQN